MKIFENFYENLYEGVDRQFTLEFVNSMGDTIGREYFSTLKDAEEFAQSLIVTYSKEGSSKVRGLYITDEDDNELFASTSDDGFVWDMLKNNAQSEYSRLEGTDSRVDEGITNDIELEEKLKMCLLNLVAVYIVEDAHDYHMLTDEEVDRTFLEDNDVDQYPEEVLLSYTDDELLAIPLDKLHKLTNTELLDRIYQLDKHLLTGSQKERLSQMYKNRNLILRPEFVKLMLAGLQSCDTIFVERSVKNLDFAREFNMTPEKYMSVFKQIQPSDYVKNTESTHTERLGDNLIVFNVHNVQIDNQSVDLELYVKVDINLSDEYCVDAVSFHKLNQFESLTEDDKNVITAEQKLLNLAKVSKDCTLNQLTITVTPKGNYNILCDGKDLITVGRHKFTSTDIETLYDLGYIESQLNEGVDNSDDIYDYPDDVDFCIQEGHNLTKEFIESQPDRVSNKIKKDMNTLSEQGITARRPLQDYLRDDIHELKTKFQHTNYRILFFFYTADNKIVFTHGITKKDEVPDKEIDKAIFLMNKYKGEHDENQ